MKKTQTREISLIHWPQNSGFLVLLIMKLRSSQHSHKEETTIWECFYICLSSFNCKCTSPISSYSQILDKMKIVIVHFLDTQKEKKRIFLTLDIKVTHQICICRKIPLEPFLEACNPEETKSSGEGTSNLKGSV